MTLNKTSPAANVVSKPMAGASQGTQTTQPTSSAAKPKEASSAGSTTTLSGHTLGDSHRTLAVEGKTSPQIKKAAKPNQIPPAGDQPQPTTRETPEPKTGASLAGQTPPTPTKEGTEPIGPASGLEDPFLALAADVVDDLEKVRIANENRLRQLTRNEADTDGEERGFGLTADHPDVARLAALVTMLAEAEHKAVLNLQRAMRQHPLGPWVKTQKGVGEKQAARLLAAISDPYWNDLHDRPRTVSELWAYCGLHVLPAGQLLPETQTARASGAKPGHTDQISDDTQLRLVGVAAKRQRGQKANWSTTAKTRAYLIAESCIKNRESPYRAVYDEGREKYADAIHKTPCTRCGPKNKPALEGSPLSAGHQHARAMRLVMKAILKTVWIEAKRIHEIEGEE